MRNVSQQDDERLVERERLLRKDPGVSVECGDKRKVRITLSKREFRFYPLLLKNGATFER